MAFEIPIERIDDYRIKVDWDYVDYVPKTDSEFIECLASKLWRLNNIYYIKNKTGNIVKFRMNAAQRLVAEIIHNRKVILKSRQLGMSTYHLIYNLDESIFKDNLTNGILAQDLEAAKNLLTKCNEAWNYLDPRIKEFLNLDIDSDNKTEFSFSNNSKILIKTSFRSGTLQNLHISELGKIAATDPKKSQEIKTGTLQAIGGGRKVTIESTAEGNSGLFYDIWHKAIRMQQEGSVFSELDFYPIFLSWVGDPDCVLETNKLISEDMAEYFNNLEFEIGQTLTQQQKNFYITKLEELGDSIKQEYPSTSAEAFEASKDGRYYAKEMNILRQSGRIQENLFNPHLPVIVTMDLGMNDDFVLLFAQTFQGECRIIDCYACNGEGLLHYAQKLFEYKTHKGYNYGNIYGPHDIVVTELTSGKSRRDVFREYGINIQTIPRKLVVDGIEAVRIMLKNTWIDASCVDLIKSLDSYTKKFDTHRGIWENKPKHDEHSHIADAVRYLALSPDIQYLAVSESSEIYNIGQSDDSDGYNPEIGFMI